MTQFKIVYQEYCNSYVIYTMRNFYWEIRKRAPRVKAEQATVLLNRFGQYEVYCDSYVEVRNKRNYASETPIIFSTEKPKDLLLTVRNKQVYIYEL